MSARAAALDEDAAPLMSQGTTILRVGVSSAHAPSPDSGFRTSVDDAATTPDSAVPLPAPQSGPKAETPLLHALPALAFWCVTSWFMILSNKMLFDGPFRFPLTLMVCHTGLAAIATGISESGERLAALPLREPAIAYLRSARDRVARHASCCD